MTSKLRVINGAVMFPGAYPVADKTRLKDLIDLAGVINQKQLQYFTVKIYKRKRYISFIRA